MEAKIKCVNFLKIRLDIIHPEQLSEAINDLLASHSSVTGTGKNIVLLSVWDLIRTRFNKEYRSYVQDASLVIPISKSLVSGVKFLTGETIYRYMPFNFVINLLSILESREYTAYLLGKNFKIVNKTENNLRRTFPGLRIVGRFSGSFRKQGGQGIMEAIHKAAPHLLLAGKGVPGGELWIARNQQHFGKGLRLWCSDLFDIFAEKKKRPSEKVFEYGLETYLYCLRNPLKIFRIFPFIWYIMRLLFYKLFRK